MPPPASPKHERSATLRDRRQAGGGARCLAQASPARRHVPPHRMRRMVPPTFHGCRRLRFYCLMEAGRRRSRNRRQRPDCPARRHLPPSLPLPSQDGESQRAMARLMWREARKADPYSCLWECRHVVELCLPWLRSRQRTVRLRCCTMVPVPRGKTTRARVRVQTNRAC